MSLTVNASTSVVLVETSKITDPFIVYFPRFFSASRYITVRDQDGYASEETPIILSTIGDTIIQPEISELVIDQPYGFFTLQNIAEGVFDVVNSFNIFEDFATVNTSNLSANDVIGLTSLTLIDKVNQTETALYSSNDILYANDVEIGDVTNTELQSTINNLGALGYISTAPTVYDIYPSYVATGSAVRLSSINVSIEPILITNTNNLENLVWVAGGTSNSNNQGNTLAYSSDGSNWIGLGCNIFSASCETIATNGSNLWIAGGGRGQANTFAFSTDGSNWTGLGIDSVIWGPYSIVYGNNLWVVAADVGPSGPFNTLGYSLDGINWTGLGCNIFDVGYAIAYNGSNLWVAGGLSYSVIGNTLAYSANGSNWTGLGKSIFSGFAYGIAYGNGLWVAVGAGINTIAYSTNGINWTGLGNLFFQTGFGIAYGNGLWVALGSYATFPNGTTMAISTDGSNWISLGSTTFPVAGFSAFYNNGLWVAAGRGFNNVPSGNSLAYSIDGSNWIGLGRSLFGWGGLDVISKGGTGIQGYLGQSGTTQYSLDGAVDWSNAIGTRGFTNYGTGTTYSEDSNIFVAVGQNNTGQSNLGYNQWSSNGITWYNSLSPPLNNTQTRLAVSYANGLFHSVGSNGSSGGANTILYSIDGKNWLPSAGNPFPGGYVTGITFGIDLWICCGYSPQSGPSGACMWSSDGSNWNTATTTAWTSCNVFDVTFADDVFIATCMSGTFTTSSNICFSYDGSNWFASNCYDANFVNNAMYITAAGPEVIATTLNTNQKLVYSLDYGVSWNSNADLSVTNEQIYKPFYDGNKWLVSVGGSIKQIHVAVGSGTNTLACSVDGSNWTGLGSSIFSVQGNAVIWNGNLFVAVGQGTNTIATSPDGINWTGRGASIFTTAGLAVGWNGSQFVAVGSGINTIALSSDGVNWTGLGNIIDGTPTRAGVAWNGALWVVTDNGNTPLITSSTGYDWTAQLNPAGSASKNVAWGGSLFVAVGDGITETIITSSDGIAWTGRGNTVFSTRGNAVAWNGSLWVAVGTGTNTIATSTDGITWVGRGNPFGGASAEGFGISWNGGFWVATGSGTNRIVYSIDAIFWTAVPNSTSIFTTTGLGITYSLPRNNSPLWIIPGSFSDLIVSYDGINYSKINNSPIKFPTGIAWNGYMYVMVGGIGNPTPLLARSFDGITWTRGQSTLYAEGIVWNANIWIIVGSGGIIKSSDGINWSSIINIFGSGWGRDIAWNGNIWVAVASSGTNIIVYSSDATTWSPATHPFTSCFGVAWNGSLWVAVGIGSTDTIATSTDGVTWVGRGKSVFTSEGTKVAWGNNLWVAVGYGTNTVATSIDGISWIGNRSGSDFFSGGDSVTWNGEYWLVSGRPLDSLNSKYTIIRSSDGLTWTGVTRINRSYSAVYSRLNLPPIWLVPGYGDIARSIDGINFTNYALTALNNEVNGFGYDGKVWLAVGRGTNDTIASSVDGITWVGRGKVANTTSIESIVWNGTLWVLNGENSASSTAILATSPDGIFWTPRTIFWQYPRSILWDGQKWFATGYKGTGTAVGAVSYDGIIWSPINIPLNVSVNDIAFSGSLYVAVGQGDVNNVATSTDGITWIGRGMTPLNEFIFGVAWKENIFVAVGRGSGGQMIISSPDGITWTTRESNPFFADYGYGVGANATTFVATGVGSGGTNTLAYSLDGITWIGLGKANFPVAGRTGIAYTPTLVNPVAYPALYFSTDLKTWYPSPSNVRYPAGGVITSITGRSIDTNINLVYQSSLQGTAVNSISTLNTDSLVANSITASIASISSLFLTIQNVSTTQEASSITSTINVDNSFVNILNARTGYVSSLYIDYLSVTTLNTDIFNVNYLNTSNIYASTISTTNLELRNNIISIGLNTGPAPNYGRINPETDSIALGAFAGNSNARSNAIAIGYRAGFLNASTGSIAIGGNAGSNTIGEYSIAIGTDAGSNFMSSHCIILNASTQSITTNISSSLYVNPIRVITEQAEINQISSLYYTLNSGEIKYGAHLDSFNPSSLITSTLGINGGVAEGITMQVNGPANISYIGGNVRFGVSTVYDGLAITYNSINVGRRNTEIVSGKGGGSQGWINFFPGVADGTSATNQMPPFTVANNKVGVNVSTPQVTMDISGSLRAYSSIQTSQLSVGSINGIPFGPQYSVGSNLTVSTLILNNALISQSTFVNALSTGNLAFNQAGEIQYVLVGGGGGGNTIASSYDGVTWTVRNNPFGIGGGRKVKYGNGIWVAVGGTQNSTIATSVDGITWTPRGDPFQTYTGWGDGIGAFDVAYNGSLWVAVAWGTNTVATSIDGITWTPQGAPISAGRGVGWNGSYWLVVGNTASPSLPTVIRSTDGITWQTSAGGPRGLNPFANYGNGVTWNGSYWVATGQFATVLIAADGFTWTETSSYLEPFVDSTSHRSAWNGSYWIITGGNAGATIVKTPDATTFQKVAFVGGMTDVLWNGNSWFVVGPGGAGFYTSTDGVVWTGRSQPLTSPYGIGQRPAEAGISFSAPLQSTILIHRPIKENWVAVGLSSITIASSPDGTTWTDRSSGIFSGIANAAGYGVSWNGEQFVAVGYGATNTIATSPDGITWTGRGRTVFTGAGYGVTYGAGLWVAVGNGGNFIASSPDGITWTGRGAGVFTNFGLGVAFGGNLFVAVGEGTNTIATSADGITWTGRGATIFTQGRGVAWNGYMWVAVGGGTNTIAYSYDGINWTGLGTTIFSTKAFRIAWNGRLWVAVGNGTNEIATSPDGINWTGRAVGTIFTGAGSAIAWNGTKFVAGGSGTNTLADSPNGINWTGQGLTAFDDAVIDIAYSWTTYPDISMSNLDFYLQSQPTYTNTKNQIFTTASTIVLNNTLYIDRFTSSVGVNIGIPDYNLHVVGNMRMSSTLIGGLGILSNTTVVTSDSNIKENIQFADLNRCVEIVEQIPLRRYTFVTPYQDYVYDKSQIGFLAQDVEKVFPHAILSMYDDQFNRDIQYVSKDQMFMAHYGATQKLIDMLEYQTCQISSLYSRIEVLKNFLSPSTYTNNV
jgi:hypothetical protein